METREILTLLLLLMNFLLLAFNSFHSIQTGRSQSKYKKRTAWYNAEIFNRGRIEDYYKSLETVSVNKEFSAVEKCQKIDEALADFHSAVIDYSRIISDKHCILLKKTVTSACDELLDEVIRGDAGAQEIAKMIRIHRLKFLKILFDEDILGDLNKGGTA